MIKKLDLGPVHIVGRSYGSSVGLALAQQHPELVKSAFLFEPAHPTWVTDPAKTKAIQDDRALIAPVTKAVKAGDDVAAATALLDWVGDRTGVLQSWSPESQAMVKDNARTTLLPQAAPPVFSCDQLGQINPRVTIARGEKTRAFFRLVADTATACMRQGRHLVVPGATHTWPADDAAGFSETVLTSLKGH